MTNTSTHHAFCFTLFTLVGLAFCVAFTSSLASNPTLRDYSLAPRETVFTPNQGEANPARTQTPSMSLPCPAEPAMIQVAL